MSDKMGDADKPQLASVEISDATLLQIAELLPPIAQWAAEVYDQPKTSPADVVAFAVASLHESVFTKAHAMLAEDKGREAETRGGAVH